MAQLTTHGTPQPFFVNLTVQCLVGMGLRGTAAAMVGAMLVLLMGLSGNATACACGADGSASLAGSSSIHNATDLAAMGAEFHNMANATGGNVTSDVEGTISGLPEQIQQWYDEAERNKDETIWTVGGRVIEIYGDAVKYWPKRTPGVEVAGSGGPQPIPGPPDPGGVFATRSDNLPSPPSEDEARDSLEKAIGEDVGDEAEEEPEPSQNATTPSEEGINKTVRSESTGASAIESDDPDPAALNQEDNTPPTRDMRPLVKTPQVAHEIPPATLALMATAGLSFVAVLTWILLKTGSIARIVAGGPLTGLFSRQTGRQVLNHPVRAGIHAAIAQNPGITSSALSEVTGCVPSVLRYHVGVLGREELIRIASRGKIHHYHDATRPLSDAERARECLFWRRRGWLATTILKRPGATQQDVARLAGLPASRVCAYTQELARAGLVRSERCGRCRRYYPTQLLESMQSSGQVPQA